MVIHKASPAEMEKPKPKWKKEKMKQEKKENVKSKRAGKTM